MGLQLRHNSVCKLTRSVNRFGIPETHSDIKVVESQITCLETKPVVPFYPYVYQATTGVHVAPRSANHLEVALSGVAAVYVPKPFALRERLHF